MGDTCLFNRKPDNSEPGDDGRNRARSDTLAEDPLFNRIFFRSSVCRQESVENVKSRTGERSKVSEAEIANHGIIERIKLPADFKAATLTEEDKWNHFLEFRVSGNAAKICYEQSDNKLSVDDRNALKKLFKEKLSEAHPCRALDLEYSQEGEPRSVDDAKAYNALCQCFVFGGRLAPSGGLINEEQSRWEIRRVGSGDKARNMIFGNLRFDGPDGKLLDKRTLVVLPISPGAEGCGYLWMEGTAKKIEQYEKQFLSSLQDGTFRAVTVSQSAR